MHHATRLRVRTVIIYWEFALGVALLAFFCVALILCILGTADL